MAIEGMVVKNQNGYFSVRTNDNDLYLCKSKGRSRLLGMDILVGDRVLIDPLTENTGQISNILPRKNQLWRPPVSNVDQLIVVMATKLPAPNFFLLDELLLMGEYLKIPTYICCTKIDLCQEFPDWISKYKNIVSDAWVIDYEDKGYLEELNHLLKGKLTVFCGPSGVGKSTLINSFIGDNILLTQAISAKNRRGKNTTRHAEILPLSDGTYVMDTPGFSVLDLGNVPMNDFSSYFTEFKPFLNKCFFQDCTHINEPKCAIKLAVKNAQISLERYNSYQLLFLKWKKEAKERF